jgi:hypothetical protein
MARLPIYTQETTVQGTRSTPDMYGAGENRAQVERSQNLSDLGDAIMRRSEVIDRVRLMSDFDAEAMRMMEAAQTEGDITSDETLSNLHQNLRNLADQTVSSHRGRFFSKGEFKAQIENQVGQYYKSALGQQIKAQKTLLAQTFEQSVNTLSLTAMDAPELLPDLLTEAENRLTELRPALTADEERLYRANMRSRMAQSTIEGFYNRGDYERASELLQDETVTQFLDPNVARTMKIKVVAEQARAEREIRIQNQRVESFRARLGRDLTPQEEMRARSLPSDQKDFTPADEISQLELVQGRPASQQQIDKIFNTYVAPVSSGGSGGGASASMFGNSLRGRALQMVNDGAMAYAAGMLDPEQARQFEMAAAEAYSPVERHDPITGQWTRYQPTVPPFIQDALQRGGGAYGSAPMPLGRPAAGNQSAPSPQGMVGPGQQLTPGADLSAPSTFATPAADQPPPQAPQAEQGRTIWERRRNLAGPVAAGTAFVYGIPGVGPSIAGERGDQIRQDRKFADGMTNTMVAVLQRNPKYAEGEREMLKQEFSLGPRAFLSQEAFESDMKGLEQILLENRQDALNIIALGETENATGKEAYAWAISAVPQIDNFFRVMGMPVLVESQELYDSLPSGTLMRDRQGREFVKP